MNTSPIFTYYLLFFTIGFILFSCNDSSFSDSASKSNPYHPEDPNINYVPENLTEKEFQQILTQINNLPKVEVLKYASVSGKPVEACMFFSWKYSNHHCNDAKFRVIINGSDLGQLNLNNATSRPVTTLKTKRVLDVGTPLKIYVDLPRDPPDEDYVITDVPGSLFKSSWNSEGKLEVNTVCDTGEGRCHTDTSSFALLGTMDINYKGVSVKKTLRSKLNVLYTDKPVTYNFKEIDIESLDNKTYEFDDWCNIIEVP